MKMNTLYLASFVLVLCLSNTCVKAAPTSNPMEDSAIISDVEYEYSLCSQTDYDNCPNLENNDDCETVQEPHGGCCKMCAKEEGERCNGRICKTGLECVPSINDYNLYGDTMELLFAKLHCTDVSSLPKSNYTEYVKEFVEERDDSSESKQTDPEDETIIHPVIMIPLPDDDPSRIRRTSPPKSPISLLVTKPCKAHLEVYYALAPSRFGWMPDCRSDEKEAATTYDIMQCEKSFGQEYGRCWCVNEKGEALSGFLPGNEPDKTACSQYIETEDQ